MTFRGKATHRSTVSRFDSAEIDPSASIGLSPTHPAAIEGRTIFPTTVVSVMQSQRLLVSGHNNPKLGKAVLKGPRTGWPIFQVSLEERATCPRSCAQWLTCYGSAMPYARRHAADEHLIPVLKAEVMTAARAHPEGLLVRLHALGDFYSTAYVEAWVELLARHPNLAVFGYTARTEDADDAESRKIAKLIRLVTTQAWDRFSIRFSRAEKGPGRSIVVDADPGEADVIVCPAQTKQTEACATCGLCWAAGARDKTIAFLRHGMKRHDGPRAPRAAVIPVKPAAALAAPKQAEPVAETETHTDRVFAKLKAALPALFRDFPDGASSADVMAAVGEDYTRCTKAAMTADRQGLARWIYAGGQRKGKILLPPHKRHVPVEGLSDNQAAVLDAMKSAAVDGVFSGPITKACKDAGVAAGSAGFLIERLERKGFIERTKGEHGFFVFRIVGLTPPKPVRKLAEMPVERRPAPTRAPTDVSAKLLGDPGRPAHSPAAAPVVDPADAPIILADTVLKGPQHLRGLGLDQCKWPLDDPGEGRMDRTMFCAAPTGGPTYCAKHTARAYGRQPQGDRA